MRVRMAVGERMERLPEPEIGYTIKSLCRYDVIVDGQEYGIDFDEDSKQNREIANAILSAYVIDEGHELTSVEPAQIPQEDGMDGSVKFAILDLDSQ